MKTDAAGKTTLSTGEAAGFLGVSRTAIVRAVEQYGKLQQGPRLHERAHRRIPVDEVMEFLRRNRMDIPQELQRFA